ncbi:MAG: aminoacyl-tRNA hydrolase [Acidobacteria bacterium 13_1_40CM_65_14]|nr:MAG: aminoacyl-tRNA hydrolase [Acidobacteria bacterium 13_1_40CM_65_14]OLC83126.1 MAG: aminoacyl-tRNA hydrolase [Acidobacteria bacterium 13_1_40CM_4_65_8]OLD16303.1 MAG: aminoacyl-tRNA hydrolase [Acidobacteria bacterium 13_1_40CM_3_65_5]OLE81026.1 MAG: aminoacyl-tRNA hydrolase [Acidobacteria bacterium 13_1_20CM_2_65_9]
MKAIVGLGNPGSEYKGTRHNVGFEVVDELARRWKVRLKSWKSRANLVLVRDHDVLLVEPKTFMNLSGQAVSGVMAFYKIQPADVLVVVDEVQLPLGKLRLRRSGSAGGHNGLKSVIEHVGTDFPRLRIGVDRGDRNWDLADRVLSRFPADEREIVDAAIARAADAAETFVSDGVELAMNRFNAAGDNLKSEI